MSQNLFNQEHTSTSEPITVLGKTFNSEEERRIWFREELRKKLPELKKMEGFPIGEDEDILNLSDPPYYTACPNPWLNDFIAEWEEEKEELEKQGKRKADFEVTEPYAADVSEGKNNPIYRAHSYHTKVPHPAIMRYIMHYTQPGDVVFDGFAGTGMTGVAASMCANPDADFKLSVEKENPNAKWGRRKCICSDLSPIASFLSFNFNFFHDYNDFENTTDKIINRIEDEFGWIYHTKHSNGDIGVVSYTIWSDIISCDNCGYENSYWDYFISYEDGRSIDKANCINCSSEIIRKKATKVWINIYDTILKKVIKILKKSPVFISYNYKGKTFTKKPDSFDFANLERIENFELRSFFPTKKFPEGFNTIQPKRSDGISYTHQIYTKRNLIISSILQEAYKDIPKAYWSTFNTIWHATKMRRFNARGGHRPMTGTLYVPSCSSEGNMLNVHKNKLSQIRSFLAAIKDFKNGSTINQTGDAGNQLIASNSVDYIFTDPPFGANIMYSELNFLWESWLKVSTNNKNEAIENKVQGKLFLDYQKLITYCFKEFFRILKYDKWMTVEFSNTSAAIWNSIQISIQNAGFIVANVSALDKKQGSFKAVSTVTAVKQDLIISCYKPSSEFNQKFNQHKDTDKGVWEFVAEHLDHLPIHLVKDNSTTAIIERSPKILFDRMIAFYVQRGLPVPIDAAKFQQGLREQFIERDGMFFTNEQVQVYDKKKAAVPNFVQLSIFVGNEQDAIYWLRNTLEKEPKTEQDLHPLWMKEVAGNMRKGDTLPEMRTILEENFLKNDDGQWYLPDPENEADLEKLRHSRLLRQFGTYVNEISNKPKAKIKEVRVEALRAGFKQCYQDKDFKTIVQVGDRIPNNLLMEDEVLLQFYDIASARA